MHLRNIYKILKPKKSRKLDVRNIDIDLKNKLAIFRNIEK